MQLLLSSHCLIIKIGCNQKHQQKLPSLSQTTFAVFCPSQCLCVLNPARSQGRPAEGVLQEPQWNSWQTFPRQSTTSIGRGSDTLAEPGAAASLGMPCQGLGSPSPGQVETASTRPPPSLGTQGFVTRSGAIRSIHVAPALPHSGGFKSDAAEPEPQSPRPRQHMQPWPPSQERCSCHPRRARAGGCPPAGQPIGVPGAWPPAEEQPGRGEGAAQQAHAADMCCARRRQTAGSGSLNAWKQHFSVSHFTEPQTITVCRCTGASEKHELLLAWRAAASSYTTPADVKIAQRCLVRSSDPLFASGSDSKAGS